MLYFAPWKIIGIVLTVVLGIVYAMPNFVPPSFYQSMPSFVPSQQINLGLDLRGGVHLLLQADIDEVVEQGMNNLKLDVRKALRDEKIGFTELRKTRDSVSVVIKDEADMEVARQALQPLLSPGQVVIFGANQQEIRLTQTGQKFELEYTEEKITALSADVVDRSIEIVRRRIDELGTTEPNIQREGADRIIVQVPGWDDPERLKNVIGQTAKMTFHLVDYTVTAEEAEAGRVPPGTKLLPYREREEGSTFSQSVLVKERVALSGESLVNAYAQLDQQGRGWVVAFTFNSSGSLKFGNITQQNIGRQFAVVLDDEVVTAPRINGPILGGSGIIEGGFTPETANDLAILLRAGALPAPLQVVQERTVGAGLGADSIAAGQMASIIGFSAVIVYIILSYGMFGAFANTALIVNVILIAAVLSALQATLTLPGIAGIVLTIGMAVDANVLIFERIREEARSGKTPINAIDAGYRKALSTILDANLTTLFAALVLFSLGAGPIRGFAVTLGIGIITSVFTAFVVTRFIVSLWVRARRPTLIPI